MKKRTFMIIFVMTQFVLVMLHIDKQSRLVKLSYKKQQSEQKLATLKTKKQELVATLHGLQNHQKIKQFAENDLGMTTLSLKKIKKITQSEAPRSLEEVLIKDTKSHEQSV